MVAIITLSVRVSIAAHCLLALAVLAV